MVVDIDLDQTGAFRALKNVCPEGIDSTRYNCSFTLWTGLADTSAALHYVHEDTGERSSTSVPLKAFNYCGRDIAYVELTPGAGSAAWAPGAVSHAVRHAALTREPERTVVRHRRNDRARASQSD